MADHQEPYSNLEVAPTEHGTHAPEIVNDAAASAPERDFSSDTPTIDQEKWPLKDSPGEHPTLRPGTDEKFKKDSETDVSGQNDASFTADTETLKEAGKPGDIPTFAPPPISGEHKIENAPPDEQKKKKRRRGLIFWIVVLLVVIVILGIALGVGLGVGLARNKSSSPSASSTPTAVPQNLTHGIMNGTSMSAVALPNGDKRLFFQENGGNIREALFTNATGTWISNVNDIVVTNARNDTPLSAMLVNNTGTLSASTGTNIHLFYIANNNQLASRIFVSGTWTTRDNFSPNENTNITFTTASDSKALAMTANTNDTDPSASFVFYTAQNGTAQCVSIESDGQDGIVASPGPRLPSGVQGGHILALAAGVSTSGDLTRPQVGVLTSNGTPEYSLYFSFYGNRTWSTPELQTVLVPPLPPDQQPAVPESLTLADAYPVTATLAPLPAATADPSKHSASYNESLLGDVNIAQIFVPTPNGETTGYTLFGFWVNGTNLAAYTTRNIGLSGAPKSTFPFPRLAGTTGQAGSGNVYLFHQLNETTVAQDIYSTSGGFFDSTDFAISTS